MKTRERERKTRSPSCVSLATKGDVVEGDVVGIGKERPFDLLQPFFRCAFDVVDQTRAHADATGDGRCEESKFPHLSHGLRGAGQFFHGWMDGEQTIEVLVAQIAT